MRSYYYQVRVIEQDIPKTVFQTKYKHFEFFVMSFELTNSPVAFMDLMNKVFYDCLNKFIVVFINDILVYSISHKKNEKHVRLTLKRLRGGTYSSKLTNFDSCQILAPC